MKVKSGIYCIANITTGDLYIGQTTDLVTRRYNHFRLLKIRKHHTAYLQNAWNKYGKDSFIFKVLLYCDVNMLDYYEQKVMDEFKPRYNMRLDAKSNRGHAMSEETKRKISAAQTGISRGGKGKPVISVEERLKRKQIGAEKRSQRMIEWHKNNKLVFTDEYRKKMSDSHKGQKCGESNNKSKVSTQDVVDIRFLHTKDKYSYAYLSRMYGLSITSIFNLCSGKTWKHVKEGL